MKTPLKYPGQPLHWPIRTADSQPSPTTPPAFPAGPGPVDMPKRQLGIIAGFVAFFIQVRNHSPLQLFFSHQSLRPVHETQNNPRRPSYTSGLKVDIALNRTMHQSWPFDQGPRVAAITTRQVLDDGLPILRVMHYIDDDSWAFTCGTTNETKDIRVIAMAEAMMLDASIAEVADLAPGWGAFRVSVGDVWSKYEASAV
jgi:hypothetical protein